MSSPSAPLLQMIRDAAKKKKLNTAALAKAAGLERARLKHVLAGREPLTVDELVVLSQALDLTQQLLTGVPEETIEKLAEAEALAEQAAEAEEADGFGLKTAPETRPDHLPIEPFGNHAEQCMKLGLGLGIDVFLHVDTTEAASSGVPPTVLSQFPKTMPIRLDAAFHRHHDPRFLPEGIQLTLSFDALYTCVFPWAAIRQITLVPLPPSEPEPAPEPEPEAKPTGAPFLRLVE